MNAEPLLSKIAAEFSANHFEPVMIGNAAAALHGAPVTTLDIDFMFRKTALNLTKLKSIAKRLQASILKPHYPASDLYRMVNDEQGMQLDFMTKLDGIRSDKSLRSRSSPVAFGEHELLIASLADIIKSKRAAGRSRDVAVLEILERTLNEQKNAQKEDEEGETKKRRTKGGD
jgi:hypothetical protein